MFKNLLGLVPKPFLVPEDGLVCDLKEDHFIIESISGQHLERVSISTWMRSQFKIRDGVMTVLG